MIDIHSHILPGVDDGSKSIDMSLSMIYQAYQSGVRHIVATPHFFPGLYDNYVTEELVDKFHELEKRVRNERIPIEVLKGMEILGTDTLYELLKNGNVWTINEQKYFLVEFNFDVNPEDCSRILAEASEDGFFPVIAHPERYYYVQRDPSIVYKWFKEGYGIQVNKGSLLGFFGKNVYSIANSLLRHRVVSCVASDAHDLKERSTSMKKLSEFLKENYGSNYTKLLTDENPRRIVSGNSLVGYDPIPYNYKSGRRSEK